jgi:hypothetical protein
MTSEELKSHRRAICEALIEGKQGQIKQNNHPITGWIDSPAHNCAMWLFHDWATYSVRIKPEPRKCWVGWLKNGFALASDRKDLNDPDVVKWQEVTEASE